LTSLRVVPGAPSEEQPRCQLPRSLSTGGECLEDDAEREMERATGPDQRSGELQVRARVDEEPRVLVAEPEKPELVEAPADDALILEGQLEGLW